MRYERTGSGDNENAYAVISFKTEGGDIILFPDNYFVSPAIGETVKVLYDPVNPSEARIYKWLSLWSWDVLMLGIGIPAIVFATIRLRRYKVQQIYDQTHA